MHFRRVGHILVDYLEGAYVQRWWDYSRLLYGDAFREHCDQIIERIKESEGSRLIDWNVASSRTESDKSGNTDV